MTSVLTAMPLRPITVAEGCLASVVTVLKSRWLVRPTRAYILQNVLLVGLLSLVLPKLQDARDEVCCSVRIDALRPSKL